MPERARGVVLASCAALVVSTAAAVLPGSSASAGPAPNAGVPTHTITLVTGDRVRYSGSGTGLRIVATTPARSRAHVAFARTTEGGDTYVLPSDAWSALHTGSIDRRLFDISLLAREGLDDRHSTRVGVIVTDSPGAAPSVAVPAAAHATSHRLPAVGATTIATAKAHAATLWAALRAHSMPRGAKLWLDGRVHATLDQSVPLIGAPTAWRHGYTGAGVTIAELDTGMDTAHPDLAGKVAASKNFSDARDATDHFGHGTHVASIITGSGAASGGRYKGVAPGVKLLNGKVLDDTGSGDESWILAGMDWAVQQHAKIVSMSLGGAPSDGTDVLSAEVNKLSKSSGTLFVVAAGNFGAAGTVSSPASADAALAVASTTKQDRLSSFSSRGPRIGDYGLKPDIAAPGSDIVAARAPGVFPDDAVDEYYVRLSGTSMATPHVAGAAAILAQEHPSWSGAQLKAALMDSSKVLARQGVFDIGAGRVDVAAATEDTVHALDADAAFGVLSTDAATAQRTVRYENDAATPVTLHLRLSTTNAAGNSAPAGLFIVNDSALTVPAHGTATEQIRLAPRAAAPGDYAGRLIATTGRTELVTPVGADLHAPMHHLTLGVIGHDGHPVTADNLIAVLQNEKTGETIVLPDENGNLAADVPAGQYRVIGTALGSTPDPVFSDEVTEFIRPAVAVSSDRTLTVDLTGAPAAHAAVDRPDAQPDGLSAQFALASKVHGSAVTTDPVMASNYPHIFISAQTAVPGVTFAYLATWSRPQDSVQMVAAHPAVAGDVIDNSDAGWRGDITAPLIDIGETVDPAKLPDVQGKVVLVAPPTTGSDGTPPTDAQLTALAHALHDRGARLVLSFDYFADTTTIPVLQLFDPNDIQRLRDAMAAGQHTIHVIGRPTSPYVYALYRTTTGALPHGLDWTFRRRDLARVDQTFRQPITPPHFSNDLYSVTDPTTGLSGGAEHQGIYPVRRTDYFSPGVAWSMLSGVGNPQNQNLGEPADELSGTVTYRAGQRLGASWGTAPFSPALPDVVPTGEDGNPLPWAYRQGDKVYASIPPLTSAEPRHELLNGSSVFLGATTDTGSTALYRGDRLVDRSDEPGVAGFSLPAGNSEYRLVVDADRRLPGWVLSPHVHAEWTFRSGATNPSRRSALDLLSAHLDLPLDLHDRASGRRPLRGSVNVDHQAGSAQIPVRSLRLDVSYDGRTWHAADVSPRGSGRFAVTIPRTGRGAHYASLRITASDWLGNMVTESLDRAYGISG